MKVWVVTGWNAQTGKDVIEVYSDKAEAIRRAHKLLAPAHVYGSLVECVVR